MRILIAEDDRVSATIIERIVAKVGFPCETVSDGRQAVERLAEKSFDIVLTDWMMPEMDGIALVRHIRGRPGPQPLIVMITAVSTHGALDHAMESGADDFLAKPVDASQVLKSIRTLIRRRRQATPTLPKKTAAGPTATKWEAAKPVASAPPAPYVAVVIGASTGGPAALQTVFESLPSNAASAAFFLVLHGPVWMLKSYPPSLARHTTLGVQQAVGGDVPEPGWLYVAPGDRHLRIGRSDYRIEIDNGPKQNYVKPAADPLFQSAADAFGPAALAVVLTGMGRDAFRGAAAIKSAGGTVLVQDPADSVAKGMPGTVVDAGLADEILPLRRIGPAIAQRIAQLHPRPRPVPAPVRRRTTRSATA